MYFAESPEDLLFNWKQFLCKKLTELECDNNVAICHFLLIAYSCIVCYSFHDKIVYQHVIFQ